MLLVSLVVLLVLIGLPMVMGMGAAGCAACDQALSSPGSSCPFVLPMMLALALTLIARRLLLRPTVLTGLLRGALLERPPQVALAR